MKIVELSTDRIPSPPPKGGAIERYVFQLSRELARLGKNLVYLFSIDAESKLDVAENVIRICYSLNECAFLEKSIGALVSKISSPLNRNLACVTRILYSMLASLNNLDVIHNHYFTTAFAPIAYRKLINRDPLLVTHYHNVPKNNIINKLLAREYDLHLAVSNYVRRKVIEMLHIPPEKVKTLYNAVDPNEFSCNEYDGKSLREKYGIGADEVTILFIGRISPEKGLHHLVKAFRKVKSIIPYTKLVIAGPAGHFDTAMQRDIVYYNYVTRLIKELEIDKSVIYLGYIKNNKIAYNVADIVVVPSIWMDPCPTVVMEALAFCKPVVAYPVGGIPEILHGLPYDFLTVSVDTDALAEKIIEVVRNLHKINIHVLRRHVEKRFSISVIAKKFVELVNEASQR